MCLPVNLDLSSAKYDYHLKTFQENNINVVTLQETPVAATLTPFKVSEMYISPYPESTG